MKRLFCHVSGISYLGFVVHFVSFYSGGIKSDTSSPETTGEALSSTEKPEPTAVSGVPGVPPSTPAVSVVPSLPPCANCKLQEQVPGKCCAFKHRCQNL